MHFRDYLIENITGIDSNVHISIDSAKEETYKKLEKYLDEYSIDYDMGGTGTDFKCYNFRATIEVTKDFSNFVYNELPVEDVYSYTFL